MTRFAWLQSRTQTLIAAALLATVAVAAAITGVQLSHLYSSLVAHCSSGCDLAIGQFLSHDTFMQQALEILARAVPVLLGIFWGAPLLAREFESGTYRLAWTQGVTRPRWLLTKLAVGGLATLTVAGVLTLTITWWYRAHDKLGTTAYAVFDRRDIAPVAYALFAFASGALIGAIARRTVPAMAATLGVFVFARVAMSAWIRPHLLTPIHETLSLQGAGPDAPVHLGLGFSNGGPLRVFAQGDGPPNSWALSSHLIDGAGHQVSSGQMAAFFHQHCPNVNLQPPPSPTGPGMVRGTAAGPGRACLAQVAETFRVLVTYQPANRYWTFQWLETGIFVALALAAVGACYWWVTRRTN
ncbi:MAG TPA: ABC transporter permease subunit [Acidimicrobiia bacterium]|nr:ABC transporter permease subunit [Acidimicrobiia bacterium]